MADCIDATELTFDSGIIIRKPLNATTTPTVPLDPAGGTTPPEDPTSTATYPSSGEAGNLRGGKKGKKDADAEVGR